MLSKQVQQEILDQQGIYFLFSDNCWHFFRYALWDNQWLLVSNTKMSITLEAFFFQTPSINHSHG